MVQAFILLSAFFFILPAKSSVELTLVKRTHWRIPFQPKIFPERLIAHVAGNSKAARPFIYNEVLLFSDRTGKSKFAVYLDASSFSPESHYAYYELIGDAGTPTRGKRVSVEQWNRFKSLRATPGCPLTIKLALDATLRKLRSTCPNYN